jgi:hypothetical protein
MPHADQSTTVRGAELAGECADLEGKDGIVDALFL